MGVVKINANSTDQRCAAVFIVAVFILPPVQTSNTFIIVFSSSGVIDKRRIISLGGNNHGLSSSGNP